MRNRLNALADASDIDALTRRINGGMLGAADRREAYRIALAAFSGASRTALA